MFLEDTGLEEYVEQWVQLFGYTQAEVMVMGWRWKLGPFNTHAKFTAGRLDACLGLVDKTCIPVGSAFHAMLKMQPQYHYRIYR